ncbi:hypothetical protein BRADI_2g62566v3 [Brachypodium distachyon]|uniref:TROVE domain-containing protein n=1 Tax=Brachypodium distachyon TaxID=15368 RepID=A0A0Q3KL05_BRADI|nr:hypothetical protein BRADI_2g62566v3 [Brachypodium distachyon]
MAMETEPAAASFLLGPPVIRGVRPPPPAAGDAAPASHPFVDLLDAAFNAPSASELKSLRKPHRALTENCSATYANSGNPCLDFFFQVDPDTALKLACNLRGVRGTGKSDKEAFYAAALWLHANHPRTLACNVAALAQFGYLKDFPELLFRLVRGPEVRKERRKEKELRKQREGLRERLSGRKRAREAAPVLLKATFGYYLSAALAKAKSKPMEIQTPEQEPEAMEVDQNQITEKKPRGMSKKVRKFLADLLASDLEQMAPGGKRNKIGLAAKWCPTPGSSFYHTTLLCEAIARRFFPEEHYVYRVLHREVLVPLRELLKLPEVYMSSQRWAELPYARVASVAMKRYKSKSQFKKHDELRFAKYLEDVDAGKAKIAAGALLPHEIAAPAYRGEDDEVSELQWRRMVDDLHAKGSLRNCISVCDVSGSMEGTPMEVCIALGVLTSELSEEPWAGKVITFHSRPSIHVIKGNTLRAKMNFVERLEWHGSTNFQGVFDQILRTAVEARLAPEKMIRTVLVYSDMEFNEATGRGYCYGSGSWDTDYKVICDKFEDAGYGDVVPQIVFWNLRDSKSTPVTSTQPGVAMVSGFSKNFLKIFLQKDGVVNPEAIMNEAIAGEEYQKLAVFD